jgi:hypothetical protein
MDEENWFVVERDLSIITDLEATHRPGDKKRRINGNKQRGYASLLINDKLMQILNEPNGVRETLHNLVKYSSGSNFVFQKETTKKQCEGQKVIQYNKTRKVIQASDTR